MESFISLGSPGLTSPELQRGLSGSTEVGQGGGNKEGGVWLCHSDRRASPSLGRRPLRAGEA